MRVFLYSSSPPPWHPCLENFEKILRRFWKKMSLKFDVYRKIWSELRNLKKLFFKFSKNSEEILFRLRYEKPDIWGREEVGDYEDFIYKISEISAKMSITELSWSILKIWHEVHFFFSLPKKQNLSNSARIAQFYDLASRLNSKIRTP